jgi:hypothetical protein
MDITKTKAIDKLLNRNVNVEKLYPRDTLKTVNYLHKSSKG